MTSIRTRALKHPASATLAGRQRLRMTMAGVLLCVLIGACSTQARAPMPITTQQRSQLDKLAASKDSPEGLREALAGIDAMEKRRTCQDRTAAVAQQMKTIGLTNAAVLAGGRMGGRATTTAAKMVAVMNAKAIRAQVSQLPSSCVDPKT